ncbi:glyoxalase [Reichenbachiella sp. 5M10]|uniref:VOC family protein n=1 Tax=Reichenbachiella sp. 5M10 TaxID=1889772 RepID=UPI000C146668|nr:glyoxalase [Reichenbachiella sp. 5M10]PIB36288.1 glyoxalase [Reichenbachiella sp. 5M10]
MKRVSGIGGVFFKSKDPQKLREWYRDRLGLVTNEYGALFETRNAIDPSKENYLQWSPMDEKTDYYAPSDQDFMINYRVENLTGLLEVLIKEGVEQVGEMEEYEYGKFAWVMDPEGRKIELWEPVDEVFTKEYADKSETTK